MWRTRPQQQPRRPPMELYERFPSPELECGHANRFYPLAILTQREEYQEKANEKKNKGLSFPHLPNELLVMIWTHAAKEWVEQGLEYLPIPLSTNGNPGTTKGYLLQIESLLEDIEPFNLLWTCRDTRAAMYDALLSAVGVEDPIEPGMLPIIKAGKREDALLFLRDTTRANMETKMPKVCGLLIQDFRLPNLDQRMAVEQERLKEMAQELTDIAVVDEFIRIENLKTRYAEEGRHDFNPLYAVWSGRFSAAEVVDLERTYDTDQPEPEIVDRSESYVRVPTLSPFGGRSMQGWRRRGGALMRRGGGGRTICRPSSSGLEERVRWAVDHRGWEDGMEELWDQSDAEGRTV